MAASLPRHLRLPPARHPHPNQVVTGDRWRISVLDAGLVRLEWSPAGSFTDRASQTVVDRRLTEQDEVDFRVRESPRALEVITDRLHLTYDRGPFTPHGLSVQARGGISKYHSVWRYGLPAQGNLGGTTRTLDDVDGPAPLQDGIMSRHGIAVLDDSATVLLTEDGWFSPREPGSLDLYVFCYGRDYRTALTAFYRLTGRQPPIPRFALGVWWSRYHRYTAGEYLDLVDRFAAAGIPMSVGVIDMDWHPVVIDPDLGSGWTGYTWNRELFPDPAAFLTALHERGLRVTLNVHPADGIRAHEACYRDAAAALGRDPDDGLAIAFDPTDPDFLRVYLEQAHHTLEAEGVDFWWVDWQQGHISAMTGLDPLWLLNHLHFLDSARAGSAMAGRPMTFSRYAGPGSHRYPIGFSGDTVTSWASLAFQPEFTATATNIGYGWWSHDIGGHLFGAKDDELATRWTQLGTFSPILRLHSTSDPFNTKEPWRFGEVARRVMTRYLRLRHRFVPYLASSAHDAHRDGRCLIEPMYYEYPWQEAAYRVPNQFRFGTELVVAPVTTPCDPATRRAATTVWLPDGTWVDVLTGLAYAGGHTLVLHRDIDTLPVLARAGTLLPLLPEPAGPPVEPAPPAAELNRTGPPSALEIWLVAGADASFTLAEDADDDAWAYTDLAYDHLAGTVSISPVRGAATTVPETRALILVVLGVPTLRAARRDGAPLAVGAGPVPGSHRIDVGTVRAAHGTVIELDGDRQIAGNDVAPRVFDLLDQAQVAFAAKTELWRAVQSAPAAQAALAVRAVDAPTSLRDAVEEILLALPGGR